MLKQIEAKIEEHVQSILAKESICFYEYQTLVSEFNRLMAKEKEAKLEADNKAWREKMAGTLTEMVCGK